MSHQPGFDHTFSAVKIEEDETEGLTQQELTNNASYHSYIPDEDSL
jgi:hypothetical protein